MTLGVIDELPDIPGVAERWGSRIFHCPYCHGYELAQGRIGVLATSPLAVHHAILLPDWGETTYFTRGLFEPSVEEYSGDTLAFAGLFMLPKTRISSPIAAQLGCAFDNGPLGAYVQTDARKATSVRGVFACGDVATAAGAVAIAVGDGALAGAAAHPSLIF